MGVLRASAPALMGTHSPAWPLKDLDLKADLNTHSGGHAKMLARTGAKLSSENFPVSNPGDACVGPHQDRRPEQSPLVQSSECAPLLRGVFLESTGNGLTAKRLCTAISSSITAPAEVSRKQTPTA